MIRIESVLNESGSLEVRIEDQTGAKPLSACARIAPSLLEASQEDATGTRLRDALANEICGALSLLTAVRNGRPFLSARTRYRDRTHRILRVWDRYGEQMVTLDDGIGAVPWSECTYEGL